jgi:hypothetical protein
MGERAGEFAVWLKDNRWFNFDKDLMKWKYTFESGTSISKKSYEKNYMKTSEELFIIFEEENYSPYCSKCTGCGEQGCCDFLSCAYSNMKDCTYGEGYYNDLECEVKSFREIYEMVMNKEGLTMLVSDLKIEISNVYDKHLDNIMGDS